MLIEVPIQTIKSDCPMIFFNDRPVFHLTEDRQFSLGSIIIEMTLLIGSNPTETAHFHLLKMTVSFCHGVKVHLHLNVLKSVRLFLLVIQCSY